MATSRVGKQILIVVADDELATIVGRAVVSASFRPLLVRDDVAARDLLARGLEPCVVLFALESSARGRDFIQRHAADPRTARIPVIFFTPTGTREGTGRSVIVSALVAFIQTYCASQLS